VQFERLSLNRFLVFGRAGLDLYAHPPGAAAEDAHSFTSALGGSAANIAVGIVKLGGTVSLVSAVSDDSVGRFVLRELKSYGVGTDFVAVTTGEHRTSLAIVETRLENCQNTIYRNRAADFKVGPAQLDRVHWENLGALIVTGTALALEPSRSSVLEAMKRTSEAGAVVIFDADYRPYSWASAAEAAEVTRHAANMSDIVIGNDVEFSVMAGDGHDGKALARELALRSRLSVYKMGEKGSVVFTGTHSATCGVYTVDALKPTGAGDAFMAGFVMALASGTELQDAVMRGSAAAAIVVTRVGCAPAMPTSSELDAFMQIHQIPSR
jgi:5-dehydro-2-deoxygluconokinase